MSPTPHPALDDPNSWVPYRYEPSLVAAYIFTIAFTLTAFLHIFQLIRKRTWYFIPLVLGALFEAIGYVNRIMSHNNIWSLSPFIVQSLFILVAPALLAASIYIILGRIILLVDGERYSLVRQKWLTKMFVAGDVFSFLLQGAGGGIQAGGTIKSMHTGEKLIIAGLFTQLSFFAIFVAIAGMFHYRLVNDKPLQKRISSRSERSSATGSSRAILDDVPWRRHLYILYIASGLIMVRSFFRVIEYLQGNAGYLLSHEVFLYVFDAALMLVVVVLFNWRHPSEITDAYQKRRVETVDVEIQHSRRGVHRMV